MEYQRYVLGFAFSKSGQEMLVIEKSRGPQFLVGLWNGIGGKEEHSDANSVQAIIREFKEETGIDTVKSNWTQFCKFQSRDHDYEVCCFKMFSDVIFKAQTQFIPGKLMEHVDYFLVSFLLGNSRLVYNLNWLIPMALDDEILTSEVNLI